MQRAHRVPRVRAVAHLAHRPESAVEAEVVGDRLHDLQQRRGDDVDGLAALAVLLDQVERLRVDERAQHGLERLGDEIAQLAGSEAAQDEQSVLGGAPYGLVARAAQDEQQLPRRRLRQLAARDQPALAERAGERERRRSPQQRAVEVEERGRGHYAFRPAAASASSRRA